MRQLKLAIEIAQQDEVVHGRARLQVLRHGLRDAIVHQRVRRAAFYTLTIHE